MRRSYKQSSADAPRQKNSAPTPGRRYVFAITSVLLACGCVVVGQQLLSSPPLLFLAVAVMVTATYSGLRPALLAVVAAVLASDFFFLQPAYKFSMDGTVFKLAFYYFAAMLFSLYLRRRAGTIRLIFPILPF